MLPPTFNPMVEGVHKSKIFADKSCRQDLNDSTGDYISYFSKEIAKQFHFYTESKKLSAYIYLNIDKTEFDCLRFCLK